MALCRPDRWAVTAAEDRAHGGGGVTLAAIYTTLVLKTDPAHNCRAHGGGGTCRNEQSTRHRRWKPILPTVAAHAALLPLVGQRHADQAPTGAGRLSCIMQLTRLEQGADPSSACKVSAAEKNPWEGCAQLKTTTVF
jgi:hypothetical protein